MLLRSFLRTVFSLALMVTLSSTTFAVDQIPPAFTATYQLNKFGLNAAEAKVSLEHDNYRAWTYKSHTITKGMISIFRDDEIIETATLKVDGIKVKPLNYDYKHHGSKKNRDRRIVFDWDNMQANSVVSGQASSIKVLANTIDSFSLQLQMMLDLSNTGLADSYSILKKGKLEEYRFKQLPEEVISTAAGDFNAIKLLRERENSKRKTIMWTAPELHHLPVKITHVEDDGTEFSLVLSDVSGLNKQQADSHSQ